MPRWWWHRRPWPDWQSEASREFLEDVQLALVEIHERVDDTYFRPIFVGWEPAAAIR